jgi:uncharacterized protein (TIGR02687 family)
MDTAQLENALIALFERRSGIGGRKLVFWYDPKAEFEGAFEELDIGSGIQKIKLEGTPFTVKHRVLVQEPDSSFLLYAPFAEPRPQENWLLDLQMQGESFSADRAAMLFKQYGLHQRNLQDYLRDHLAFFNNKRRREALDDIGLAPESGEMELRIAMMCALVGLKVADAAQLLRTLLMKGLGEEENPLFSELVTYFKPGEVWEVARHALGFQAETPSLRELFIRLALTHLQHDLRGSLPEHLLGKVIRPSTRAYVFVNSWLRHSGDATVWAELSSRLAPDLGIPELARSLHPSAYAKVETFAAFDQELVRTAATQLVSGQGNIQEIKAWLGVRKALYWFDTFAPYYEALQAATGFFAALSEFSAGANATAGEMFRAYAERHYRVDRYYRHYLTASDETPGDVLKPLTEEIEGRYTHSFLEPLGEAWSKALAGLEDWSISKVEKQWWFYRHHLRPILEGSDREKVFVIISDALRYEVAEDLRESLFADLRGDAKLTPLLGVLPSITRLGMAALLPHDVLEVNGKGEVLVDGRPSQSSANRGAILKASGVSSLVLQAEELLNMSREEGRGLIQPHRLIYIYQNRIDAIGDKAASERGVFDACRRTVEELSALVRKIANALNGTNIFVTSDHGFLYQRQPLAQHDKVEPPEGDILDSSRRHVLGMNLSQPDGTQTFSLSYLRPDGLQAQSPWGTLRYALQGAGAQYVHGGASLHEVCVPLLAYKHVRAIKGDEGPSRKVGVRVSATSRKVTNNHFTIRLIQDEPVGERVRPRQVIVKFVDEDGKAVTNEYPLSLESSAPQATDREYIARLSIGITDPDRDKPYDLVVVDVEDALEILRESWRISLAFTDDFGDL